MQSLSVLSHKIQGLPIGRMAESAGMVLECYNISNDTLFRNIILNDILLYVEILARVLSVFSGRSIYQIDLFLLINAFLTDLISSSVFSV